MLRGTNLRKDADEYGYIYQNEPPYEMIENKWLSRDDVKKIHLAEDMLEKYWNSGRFTKTMKCVMEEVDSAFDFFYQLGCFYQDHQYKTIGYQLDELYCYLDNYLNSQEKHELLIQDYFSQFKVKPKKWYKQTLTTQERKDAIRYLVDKYSLNQELLFRYAIVEKISLGYLVVIYKDYQCDMNIYQ